MELHRHRRWHRAARIGPRRPPQAPPHPSPADPPLRLHGPVLPPLAQRHRPDRARALDGGAGRGPPVGQRAPLRQARVRHHRHRVHARRAEAPADDPRDRLGRQRCQSLRRGRGPVHRLHPRHAPWHALHRGLRQRHPAGRDRGPGAARAPRRQHGRCDGARRHRPAPAQPARRRDPASLRLRAAAAVHRPDRWTLRHHRHAPPVLGTLGGGSFRRAGPPLDADPR